MKFGALLRSQATELPEVSLLFDAYKQLKKQLKKLPEKPGGGEGGKDAGLEPVAADGPGPGPVPAAPPFVDAAMGAAAGTGGGGPQPVDIAMPAAAQPAAQPARGNAAAAVRAQAGSDAEAAHFLATLDSHLARLNLQFMEYEEEAVIRLEALAARLAAAEDAETRHSICQRLVDFQGEVLLLVHWSALAYTATVKILKKHHKRTGTLLRAPQLEGLLSQPFCSTEVMTQLAKKAADCVAAVTSNSAHAHRHRHAADADVEAGVEATGGAREHHHRSARAAAAGLSPINKVLEDGPKGLPLPGLPSSATAPAALAKAAAAAVTVTELLQQQQEWEEVAGQRPDLAAQEGKLEEDEGSALQVEEDAGAGHAQATEQPNIAEAASPLLALPAADVAALAGAIERHASTQSPPIGSPATLLAELAPAPPAAATPAASGAEAGTAALPVQGAAMQPSVAAAASGDNRLGGNAPSGTAVTGSDAAAGAGPAPPPPLQRMSTSFERVSLGDSGSAGGGGAGSGGSGGTGSGSGIGNVHAGPNSPKEVGPLRLPLKRPHLLRCTQVALDAWSRLAATASTPSTVLSPEAAARQLAMGSNTPARARCLTRSSFSPGPPPVHPAMGPPVAVVAAPGSLLAPGAPGAPAAGIPRPFPFHMRGPFAGMRDGSTGAGAAATTGPAVDVAGGPAEEGPQQKRSRLSSSS